jgi:CHASE3 domain sensor protein
MLILLYIFAGFIAGFAVAWIMRSITLANTNKLQKSTQGYLESERLMKETVQKENVIVHQAKMVVELEADRKLQEANNLIKTMDENILLLQKNNEETEALLKAGLPELNNLRIKLIEANNTIARYKGQIEK